ncbi:MAG: flagellar hook-associated protein FlgK [Thermodesulfobacteriota bacterium]|nr:flagellar hook-associated protein FlgK [Thermodesulfobacteriota bacterium]
MPSVFGIFSTGKLALLTHQKAIDVTGHNIANADTPGFSRQRLNVETREPISFWPGQMGTGVRAAEIQRIHDRLLGVQINKENQNLGRWEAQKGGLERVEMILDESTGYGLNQSMSEFWNAWHDLADDPSSQAARVALLAKGQRMGDSFQKIRADLEQIQKDIDTTIDGPIKEINLIADQIADLNQKINQIEAGGQNANDLRDQRDLLLDELSSIIDINSFENAEGKVTVLVSGGRPLVENVTSWELSTETNASGLRDIVWVDGDGTTEYLARSTTSSDMTVLTALSNMDAVAGQYQVVVNQLAQAERESHNAGEISEDSVINSSGGAQTFEYRYAGGPLITVNVPDGTTLSGLRDLINNDPNNPGVSASVLYDGIDFHLVLEGQDTGAANPIDIDPLGMATLANYVAADFNEIQTALDAQMTINGGPVVNRATNYVTDVIPGVTLDLLATGNATVTVGPDSISGGKIKGWLEVRDVAIPQYLSELDILARNMVGTVNSVHSRGYGLVDSATGEPFYAVDFFTGTSASDIAVNQAIVDDISRIAASASFGGVPGDNGNAISVANLQYGLTMNNGNASFDDYYNSLVSVIGSESREATINYDHESAVVNQLSNYRESISGVSLDEEMVNLIKFQHAYDAAAKLIATVDELLETVISMA